MNNSTSQDSFFNKFGVVVIMLALITLAFLFADEDAAKKQVSRMGGQAKADVQEYVSEQSKLQVGDLVEVRNWDNLESTRWLAVSAVDRGVAWLKNYRDYEYEPEVLRLDCGTRAALEMTEKYAFKFIRQDQPSWQANADWYWIQ